VIHHETPNLKAALAPVFDDRKNLRFHAALENRNGYPQRKIQGRLPRHRWAGGSVTGGLAIDILDLDEERPDDRRRRASVVTGCSPSGKN